MKRTKQNRLDDLSQEELDYLVGQLQKSKKQTASTASVELPFHPFLVVWKMVKFALTLLLLGIIAYFAWSFLQPTEDVKSSVTVERIQDLATLATAKMHVKTIIKKEDNKLFGKAISFNIPGTKRVLFIVVPAEVVAGVNLQHLDENDLIVNEEERTITLSLPHATFIQEPSLNMEKTEAYTSDGVFRGKPSIQEGYGLMAEATEKIKQEAINVGIMETAEQNAKQVLQDFFEELGYTTEITFH